MATSAKSQTGVQADDLAGLCGRLVPRGHDPKFRRDFHGLKLALRQTHPVLRFDFTRFITWDVDAHGIAGHIEQIIDVGVRLNQHHQARLRPRVLSRLHTWFAVQRLLRIGVRPLILDRD